MKLVKELPLYILNSIRLSSIPKSRLISPKKDTLPVIVSLTSIESRLSSLHLVIRSLLTQSHLPEKIVLWLNQELESHLPKSLTRLQSEIFEIRYSDLHCSHKKLIHSLKEYPDKVIITCDDDLMYRNNWLYLLYENHRLLPDCIIGNNTRHIGYDEKGGILPYGEWRYRHSKDANEWAVVAIGAWGILYPPGSLSEKVFDADLFLRLAPQSDDLWFKTMALLNGTKTIQALTTPKEPVPIAGTQKVSLKQINVGEHKNVKQWKALTNFFDLDRFMNRS
ncbi:glycosyl transferase [Lentiprolixibacter aurantiacus]|uniref:Glycosyl transferase n=1 Tax=Lentiprolixibacter aurantiacus TaxID=2993939 RepID=A0AAE3MP84_9FLAO|nr:glycosyl transferase [Lentiprolixibacter aurantiacus]MCX2720472.1 glycosyl transferase [Lentiprolixibacter aurantiacus]